MYKITPWHYYNTKFGTDEIKLAPNFCGGDTRDELQLLDANKAGQKVQLDTVKNLVIKTASLHKDTLAPFTNNLEHLYVCASDEINAEILQNFKDLRGFYLTHNKNFKRVPNGFFRQNATLKKIVFNHCEITLEPGVFVGLDSLEELDLQESKLTELKSGILSDLPKLQKLIVSRNKIKQIDADVFVGNNNLAHIDLSYNGLTDWKSDTLPIANNVKYLKLSYNKISTANFGSLHQIFQLSLDFNAMHKIDKTIFGENMEKLDYLALNNNKIERIEDDSFDLKALRVLLLDHNKISELNEKVFDKVPQIQKLTLHHNDMAVIQLDVFSPLNSLNTLELGCCNLKDLTNSSQTGPGCLISLHLDDNNFTRLNNRIFTGFSATTTLELNECKLEILESNWCVGLEGLKQLNLSGNNLKELKGETFSPLTSLKTLNLSGNFITTIEKSAFKNLSSLSTLNLCDNRLENVCDYMFEDLSGLRSLALGNNELAILKNNSFGHLPNLIYLDLSENRITEVEQATFEGAGCLITLDLGYNGLTKSPNLAQNLELSKLILSYNYLTTLDETSPCFKLLTNLSQVCIDHNEITSVDLSLLEACNIREFNFDDDKFEKEAVQKIRTLLQVRQIRRRSSTRIEPREKCRKVFL